ncbi:hypothetical protein Goari_010566, partial [Gossypium aridum]|nr:hypothetical protein [Gossypium aridum]
GCKLDSKLISALVERWKPESTHSIFYAVSVLSLWKTSIYSWGYQWVDDLRRLDRNAWIRRNFVEIVEDLTEVEREQYIRAIIFQIIGGILMPDKSRNLVHLRLLLKLVNFRVANEHSWGFTVLAILYREMCWAT